MSESAFCVLCAGKHDTAACPERRVVKRPERIWISPGSAESLVERPKLAMNVWGIDAFDGLIPYAPYSEARENAVRELVDEVREAIDALEESALDGHAGDLRAALAKLAAIEEAESDA